MTESILLGGCFWCIEAILEDLRGVISVESSYAGGHVEHPSYQAEYFPDDPQSDPAQ